MSTAVQKQQSRVPNAPASIRNNPSIKHQPRSQRYYFDVVLGAVCLSGKDTGGAYCLLDVSLAPRMGVPRHMHTREDEAYFVLAGELEVTVGKKTFVLRSGDTLLAPRRHPSPTPQLRQCRESLYPSIFAFRVRGVRDATAVPAPHDAVAPTEPPPVAFAMSMNSPPTTGSFSADSCQS